MTTFSTDSAAAIRAGVSQTGANKTARPDYLLTVWLIVLLAFSSAFNLAPNHPSKAKAEAGMPQLQGEEAISYLKSESLLASLQNEFRKITALDGAAQDSFGQSVAISGDTIVVGAQLSDVGGNSDQGSAYIFDNTPFDLCLQDDSARSRQLVFNSLTGDYVFCDNSVTIGGVASVTRKGNTITLNHTTTGYRLLASVSLDTRRGSASMRIFASGAVFTITDRNTSNNTCSCGAF